MTTVGSLCTGILGAELALDLMGLEPDLRWYSEIDKDACKLLAQRHPDVPNLGDLKLIEWERCEPVDVLTAGYPCQPFSTAGNRKGTDDPRHLWPWIACALRVLRPRFALFENVAAHLGLGFDAVLSDLAALGFDAEWATLRASDVGACHGRNRVFLAAHPEGAGGGMGPGRLHDRGRPAGAGGGQGIQRQRTPQDVGNEPSGEDATDADNAGCGELRGGDHSMSGTASHSTRSSERLLPTPAVSGGGGRRAT